MPNFASITLVGHVGRDCELRSTRGGTQVASTSMAVNTSRENDAKPDWYKIVFWGNQADVAAQYLTKGKAVLVNGQPRITKWSDKDGKEQTTVEVNVREFTFLGGKDEKQESKPSATNGGASDTDDSLPF